MRIKRAISKFVKDEIKKIGWNISKIRIDKNLSQKKLAYKSGISKTASSYIEKGAKDQKLSTLEKIAGGLEISLSELLNFDSTPS